MTSSEIVLQALEALYESSSRLTEHSFRGGYGGTYSVSDNRVWGESGLQSGQIWMQPPGTPAVGEMYLRSYSVTGDGSFLQAAVDVGQALAAAQRPAGGWNYTALLTDADAECLFRDVSEVVVLDDQATSAPIDFLVKLDGLVDFDWLTTAINDGLNFLTSVQSSEGGWQHNYPALVPFHGYYTFGDGVQAGATRTLVEAYRLWTDGAEAQRAELLSRAQLAADFIVGTQLSGETSGWSQYYDSELRPMQGRAMEVPAAATLDSAKTIFALLAVYEFDRDPRYLEAAVRAVEWLKESVLEFDENGQPVLWARFYDIDSNTPILAVTSNGEKLYSHEEVQAAQTAGTWVNYGWMGSWEIPHAIAAVDALMANADAFYANVFHQSPMAASRPFYQMEIVAWNLAGQWEDEAWEMTGFLDAADTQTRFFQTARYESNTLKLQQYLVVVRDEWITTGRGAEWEDLVAQARVNLTPAERPLNIKGTPANDKMIGGALSDTIRGGEGDDWISGGGAPDAMYGGLGSDRYNFDHLEDDAIELFGEGMDTIYASIVNVTLPANVEIARLFGDRNLNASGNTLDNVLFGNAGANRLDGRGGSDTMSGSTGDDRYIVDSESDRVNERPDEGFDRVFTISDYRLRAGQHVEVLGTLSRAATMPLNLTGNELANFIEGNAGSNMLSGMGSDDTLLGRGGDDQLMGGDGADRLQGGEGNDILSGGPGDDRLYGEAGENFLAGGAGDDTYYVDSQNEIVIEVASEGDDRIIATTDFILSIAAEVERLDASSRSSTQMIHLTGNDANQVIHGNSGVNVLNGGGGNDYLYGLDGNDMLNGGEGRDNLFGGGGADKFVFDSVPGLPDRIRDFSPAHDTIELDQDIFAAFAHAGTLEQSAFRSGTSPQDADDRIIYNATTGYIYYDPDGNGVEAKMLVAWVSAGTALTSDDFLIVA